MFVNYNGQLLPNDQPIFTADNRSFRYGDGLFESIRVFDGRMPFFQMHWHRLQAGIHRLKLDLPASMDCPFFQHEIEKLTAASGNWRVRLSMWRAGAGLYTPETSQVAFLIETTPLRSNHFEINDTGLSLGTFGNMRLPIHPDPVTAKTANALPQVLAAIFKNDNGFDDCLLLNTENRIACATSANVFLVKNGELHTPEVQEGCIAGTMRSAAIAQALLNGMPVNKGKIQQADLAQADEIFLTNAIQGIRWVRKIDGIDAAFERQTALILLEKINEMVLPAQ